MAKAPKITSKTLAKEAAARYGIPEKEAEIFFKRVNRRFDQCIQVGLLFTIPNLFKIDLTYLGKRLRRTGNRANNLSSPVYNRRMF